MESNEVGQTRPPRKGRVFPVYVIKGVKRFIQEITEKVPEFRIEVQDGRIRLEHLFTARLWYANPGEELVVTYKTLRDVAERVDAAAEMCEV